MPNNIPEPFLGLAKAWLKTGIDAAEAANTLRQAANWRNAASRSYYAAYSFTTCLLCMEKMNFPVDDDGTQRDGPHHVPLPDLVDNHLKKRLRQSTSQLRALVIQLYTLRITADYRPRLSVREGEITQAIKSVKIARLFAEKAMERYV